MLAKLGMEADRFVDAHGRHVLLRGVNLGGDCKVPFAPNGHSYLPSDFADHRTVSFVGRPAPLDELDAHLARIAGWGFNCLRLLTTWEAVEHAGPGQYDEAYLDYYAEVCRRAGRHGLYVFVDFHQDVWSRMSGGDGAPGWTFEAAGLDFTKFHEAGAAHVMQRNYDHRVGGRQESYPLMGWGGNYRMPANGIMWTLFFAGADFAPSATVDGGSVQTYLQDHYLGSMRAVAERVADIDNVIGFDTLNEPGTGYIGRALDSREGLLRGTAWSPLDGLAVASGLSRELPVMALGRGEIGRRRVNEGGVSIWLSGREDPFRVAGAWDADDRGEPVALRPDHFRQVADREVSMERDYMVPFFNRVAHTIRAVRDDWLVFAEVDPFGALRGHGFPEGCPERTVNASHWYDLTALITKSFDPNRMVDVLSGTVREGPVAIEDSYLEGLSKLKAIGDGLNGGAPTLIGECGFQYDMNGAEAYGRWAAGERDPAIWDAQTTALELMYNAFDRLLLSSTQWNYTASNRNDPMVGDGWNQEDLSIWSQDQSTTGDDAGSGGRAIQGFSRPYVRSAQGRIVSQRFDRASLLFEVVIDANSGVDAPTEIYAPAQFYPAPPQVTTQLSDVQWEPDKRLVLVRVAGSGEVRITLRPG
ncbi:cellulase family glycosylhydrolase [uncultured Sphingomonas sp.]|uniref:glycoside hydrolase family 5 protein n=1 Tax=uncultured Sphingomonas sp. TaxID=158754 RepID=UPI0035CC85E8